MPKRILDGGFGVVSCVVVSSVHKASVGVSSVISSVAARSSNESRRLLKDHGT